MNARSDPWSARDYIVRAEQAQAAGDLNRARMFIELLYRFLDGDPGLEEPESEISRH
jgi:hypothetical protein